MKLNVSCYVSLLVLLEDCDILSLKQAVQKRKALWEISVHQVDIDVHMKSARSGS